jgi:hypothetical protein
VTILYRLPFVTAAYRTGFTLDGHRFSTSSAGIVSQISSIADHNQRI